MYFILNISVSTFFAVFKDLFCVAPCQPPLFLRHFLLSVIHSVRLWLEYFIQQELMQFKCSFDFFLSSNFIFSSSYGNK